VPWKFASLAQNLVLQELQFQKTGVCNKFPGRVKVSNLDLMSALWMLNLTLALNRSIMNRE
jgi:hypothetical protein